jgi:hypothetical protein
LHEGHMGYKSSLDVVIEATLTELGECIREFHKKREGHLFVWDTVSSIGKTLFTRLAVSNNPVLGCGDTPGPSDYEWTWTIEALDVPAPEQAVFCHITASKMPGWVNALGEVLELNFWPDWTSEGYSDTAYVQSYKGYLSLLLSELGQLGMIQQFPEWLEEGLTEQAELQVFKRDIPEQLAIEVLCLLDRGTATPTETRYFVEKCHDELVEEFRQYLELHNSLLGTPHIEITQALNDRGVDVLLQRGFCKVGFQIKSHYDVSEEKFAANVKRQLTESYSRLKQVVLADLLTFAAQ